jgi:hypothetical protein
MFDWGFSSDFVTRFLDALLAPIQDWLAQHPVFLWLATHPWWLLITILVILFLLSGLLRAVAGLTEKLWLGLLRLPILLVQWVWRGSLFLLRRPFAPKPLALQASVTPPDRLTEVLDRLEALRQEQDELLKEVKSLLATDQKSRKL